MADNPMESFADAIKRASNGFDGTLSDTRRPSSTSNRRGNHGSMEHSSDEGYRDFGYDMNDSSERKSHRSFSGSSSSMNHNHMGSSHASSMHTQLSSKSSFNNEDTGMMVQQGFGDQEQHQQSYSYSTEAPYQSQTRCYPYYENHPIDKCENYTEKICRTSQKEHCKDVPDKNCKAIVSSGQIRKCFNVTEIICSLKEDIKYEVIQVPYAIQKCHKVPQKVCDIVYETVLKTREANPCLRVENPKCINKNYPVYDRTCKSTTYFDCDTYYYGQGASITYCRKQPDTKCYQTPRSVTQQRCYHKPEKVCEKLSLRIPSIKSKKNCHTEYKKVCALEEHAEPKQVKKYIYQKTCRKVPRSICENTDVKKLVPSCVKTTRKSCNYKPVQKCESIPRKYCYKIYKKVRKDKCEPYVEPTTPRAYPAEIPGDSSYQSMADEQNSYNGMDMTGGSNDMAMDNAMSYSAKESMGSSMSGFEHSPSMPSYKSGY
ncbi:hypothetical protein TCAL_00597 [Tigriopus californicus]|uniref:Uncharacterized protein n=1 Tax=Tigriopus californicus TaxID=6832 RepID=A0A553PA86_TIGCA|nr:hypothetical protein TCAL_00597 [Tigriopus californicus]|eukprot:TCALIF_00597-PA protein Name:"Protein of unknown function" AED:0.18 eAED:0.22 QI:11/0/0/1/1/1/2/0/485